MPNNNFILVGMRCRLMIEEQPLRLLLDSFPQQLLLGRVLRQSSGRCLSLPHTLGVELVPDFLPHVRIRCCGCYFVKVAEILIQFLHNIL